MSLSRAELATYAQRLLANYLPDGREPDARVMEAMVARAMDRIERCFAGINRKYYRDAGVATFDHLNGDHFASFLYFLGNSVSTDDGDTALATKLFYLNKIMHGLDLFYSVAMPEVFLLVHPVGTVLGRAQYGNHLVVYQNCSVGADTTVYPTFGDGVVLYSGSTVLGKSIVGDNVIFGAGSRIIDTDVPSNSVVVGQYPKHRVLPNQRPVRHTVFGQVEAQ